MGNRGVLHDDEGNVKRLWLVKRWLVCVLQFRGRKRTVMTPRRYTELFFLDEATALAAGHRPCAECRHDRFIDFCRAWKTAQRRPASSPRPTADEIDAVLHLERIARDKSKVRFAAPLDALPDGVFVLLKERGEQPFLVSGDNLLEWSPSGYSRSRSRPKKLTVEVLTPKTTVAAIRAGYTPEIHPSASISRI